MSVRNAPGRPPAARPRNRGSSTTSTGTATATSAPCPQEEADAISDGEVEMRGIPTADSSSITMAEAGEQSIAHCKAEGWSLDDQAAARASAPAHRAIDRGASACPGSRRRASSIRDRAARRRPLARHAAQGAHQLEGDPRVRAGARPRRSKRWLAVKIKTDEREAAGPMREGHDYPSLAKIRLLMDKAPSRWRPLVVTAVFTGCKRVSCAGCAGRISTWPVACCTCASGLTPGGRWGGRRPSRGARYPAGPDRHQHAAPVAAALPGRRAGVSDRRRHRHALFEPGEPVLAPADVDVRPRQVRAAALRHAAASLFIADLNWTPKRVQAVMGHASIAMTFDRYGHLFESSADDREAMRKLKAAVLAA